MIGLDLLQRGMVVLFCAVGVFAAMELAHSYRLSTDGKSRHVDNDSIDMDRLEEVARRVAPEPIDVPEADGYLAQVHDSEIPRLDRRLLRTDDYNESWRQAGTDDNGSGRTLRAHQVVVDRTIGRLTGRISVGNPAADDNRPASGLDVVLSRGTKIVAQTRTRSDGTFTLSVLESGTYGLMAFGSEGLMAYALHVRVADEPVADWPIDALAVSSPNVRQGWRLLNDYRQRRPQPIERIEPDLDRIAAPMRSLEPAGVPATSLVSHQVALQPDGRLTGRICRLQHETGRSIVARNIDVRFLKDGRILARTATDDRGLFAVHDLKPGLYGLIATGSGANPSTRGNTGLTEGFAAVGIRVLAAEVQADVDGQRVPATPVSLVETAQPAELPEIDIALVDAGGLYTLPQRTDRTENARPADPVPPATASPVAGDAAVGGGSAGGGIGGAGGLGGLATALAAGAAAAAIATDDDDHPPSTAFEP